MWRSLRSLRLCPASTLLASSFRRQHVLYCLASVSALNRPAPPPLPLRTNPEPKPPHCEMAPAMTDPTFMMAALTVHLCVRARVRLSPAPAVSSYAAVTTTGCSCLPSRIDLDQHRPRSAGCSCLPLSPTGFASSNDPMLRCPSWGSCWRHCAWADATGTRGTCTHVHEAAHTACYM
jgi:hypothetical protein